MPHDPIRDRLKLATICLLTALRPGCTYRVHVDDTYTVWLSWNEGPTRYSLTAFYDRLRATESPEEWVGRAISPEITEAIRAAAAARKEA